MGLERIQRLESQDWAFRCNAEVFNEVAWEIAKMKLFHGYRSIRFFAR